MHGHLTQTNAKQNVQQTIYVEQPVALTHYGVHFVEHPSLEKVVITKM